MENWEKTGQTPPMSRQSLCLEEIIDAVNDFCYSESKRTTGLKTVAHCILDLA